MRAIAANLLLGDSCSLVAAATKIVGCHSPFSALRKDETGTSQVLAKSPNAASICFTIQGEPQNQDAHKLEKHTIPKPWSQMCQLGEAGDHIRQAHAMLEAASKVGPPERTTQRVREGPVNYFYRRVPRTNIWPPRTNIWPDIGSRYATVKIVHSIHRSEIHHKSSPPRIEPQSGEWMDHGDRNRASCPGPCEPGVLPGTVRTVLAKQGVECSPDLPRGLRRVSENAPISRRRVGRHRQRCIDPRGTRFMMNF